MKEVQTGQSELVLSKLIAPVAEATRSMYILVTLNEVTLPRCISMRERNFIQHDMVFLA